jgi:hypothetical protein
MAQDITRVTVMGADARPVRSLTSTEDLASFREFWSRRVEVGVEAAMRRNYKIVIEAEGRSETWFYDPEGLAQVFTKKRAWVYRLLAVGGFNKLLGIAREHNHWQPASRPQAHRQSARWAA